MTITFSENLSPKLTEADFTANGAALAATVAFAGTNAKTYTLTDTASDHYLPDTGILTGSPVLLVIICRL